MSAPPARTERLDARRNREVVLRTAARVFADEGLDVSLGRIAERAGVGAGTVYRHFPSKELLVEAVLAGHVEDLVAAADRWAASAPPGAALFGFLHEVIEKSAGRRHVCDALTADRSWPRATLAAEARRFGAALDRLLHNAKRSGDVRADVHADDLAALSVAGAALRAAHRDPVRGKRLVQLMLDGVRTTTVTKDTGFRDPGRHETGRCEQCGAQLPARTTGRPPRYCGATCRQRARRRRLTRSAG